MARALRAGDGWCAGSAPACGSASIRPCSASCVTGDTSIWPGRWSTARQSARCAGGKTGPNPTDRRKAGSKHHVLTDAHGVPIVATLTAANRNDITQLLPLLDAMPTLGGRRGRPARQPRLVQGDRGYDSQPHRDELRRRGIASCLAPSLRYERGSGVHEAFLTLACSLVCWYDLKPIITSRNALLGNAPEKDPWRGHQRVRRRGVPGPRSGSPGRAPS